MSGEAIDLKQGVAADKSVRSYRRVVTGLDSAGRSIILEDAMCPNVQTIMGIPEFATTEFWKTYQTPVDLAAEPADPADGPVILPPPEGGSIFRVVEFPPDTLLKERMPGRSPQRELMHVTPSIDYVFVLEGEIYAVLDQQETPMKEGDFLIQRGTHHNWSNRSDKPCRILFVLIGAIVPPEPS